MNVVNWAKPNPIALALDSSGPASGICGQSHRLERQTVANCIPRDHFFSNRVVTDWNQLSTETINSQSVDSFKDKLDSTLF
jgi:hypothetical protein